MMDRGMVKWEPFNSVIPSSKTINNVVNKKNKIKKPILSEDQLIEIEKKVIEAFETSTEIEITYYENGFKKDILDKIKKIDNVNKKIYLLNKTIYFCQILNIN